MTDEFSKWLDTLKGVLRMKLHEFKIGMEDVYTQFGLKEGGDLHQHVYAILNGDLSPIKQLPTDHDAIYELYLYIQNIKNN